MTIGERSADLQTFVTTATMTAESSAEGVTQGKSISTSRSRGISLGEMSSSSEAAGMMSMTSSGISTGTSAGEVMTPLAQDGIFLPAPDPTVLSATRGESGAQTSSGIGDCIYPDSVGTRKNLLRISSAAILVLA